MHIEEGGYIYDDRTERKTPKELSDIEREKNFPERFPNNTDSIGIEIVEKATGPKSNEVYETVTDKQNKSLKWLVAALTSIFNVPMTEIHRHPNVGRKSKTEANQQNRNGKNKFL